MDKHELYSVMSARKSKPKDFEPYAGDNGRVNKCVALMNSGKILTNSTDGVLIDVGGGIGDLCYATKNLFKHRINIDIAEINLKATINKTDAHACKLDIDNSGFNPKEEDWISKSTKEITDIFVLGNSVDVITALDFIEHIIDPEKFARECFRLLKSGGEVFINTPNIRFWQHIEKLWVQGKFPHTSGDREVYHGGHLAFFTFSDIKEIFEGAGFTMSEQIKDEECYQQPPPFWMNVLKPTGQKDYVEKCLELGCPNLLYKATRP